MWNDCIRVQNAWVTRLDLERDMTRRLITTVHNSAMGRKKSDMIKKYSDAWPLSTDEYKHVENNITKDRLDELLKERQAILDKGKKIIVTNG